GAGFCTRQEWAGCHSGDQESTVGRQVVGPALRRDRQAPLVLDMRPCLAVHDREDCGALDSILPGKGLAPELPTVSNIRPANLEDLVIRKLCPRMAFSTVDMTLDPAAPVKHVPRVVRHRAKFHM